MRRPDGARTPRTGYAYDLHCRQHYALSTSDDPGNAKWKQRGSLQLSPQDYGLFAAKMCFKQQ
jgi:hypothetical protein